MVYSKLQIKKSYDQNVSSNCVADKNIMFESIRSLDCSKLGVDSQSLSKKILIVY